jgi:hypothetical protein
VLGVHGKLVKYVVHLSKRKNLKKIYFSSHKLPKQQSTSFWSQGILGVKKAVKRIVEFCGGIYVPPSYHDLQWKFLV